MNGQAFRVPLLPEGYCERTRPMAFNFTWAIPGGAWLEWGPFDVTDSRGRLVKETYRNWYAFTWIERHHGREFVTRHLKLQGWMTGCWVNCVY